MRYNVIPKHLLRKFISQYLDDPLFFFTGSQEVNEKIEKTADLLDWEEREYDNGDIVYLIPDYEDDDE